MSAHIVHSFSELRYANSQFSYANVILFLAVNIQYV